MITASYWEASEDWGGFQTARIIAQPFLHTKKFLPLPEKFLREEVVLRSPTDP
jgi:hypothetical protein